MTESPPLDRMQLIADYRTAVNSLKKSGKQAITYGCLCLFVGLINFDPTNVFQCLYLGVGAAEVLIGLRNRLRPSPLGVLLDLFLLALLGMWNIGVQVLVMEMGGQPWWPGAVFGFFIIIAAARRVRHFNRVRDAFREPPSESQLAWFDEVINEIRNTNSDESDDMIEFRSGLTWKGKRLGDVLIVVDHFDLENLIVDARDVDFTDRGKGLIRKNRYGQLRLGERTFSLASISPQKLDVLLSWRGDANRPEEQLLPEF